MLQALLRWRTVVTDIQTWCALLTRNHWIMTPAKTTSKRTEAKLWVVKSSSTAYHFTMVSQRVIVSRISLHHWYHNVSSCPEYHFTTGITMCHRVQDITSPLVSQCVSVCRISFHYSYPSVSSCPGHYFSTGITAAHSSPSETKKWINLKSAYSVMTIFTQNNACSNSQVPTK